MLLGRKIFTRSLSQYVCRETGCVDTKINYSFCKDQKRKDDKQEYQKFEEQQQSRYQKPSFMSMLTSRTGMIVLGIIGGFGSFYFFDKNRVQEKEKPQEIQKVQRKKPIFGGDWTLIDTNSQIFGSQQLRGQNYLIYFGFTKCPDVCPTTLYYLLSLKKHFNQIASQNEKLKIVFVSVDPARDSPQVMKAYISNFSQEFIGVTGSSEEDPNLIECKKKFKIFARKVYSEDKEDKNYNVDHTSLVFIMNKNNKYVDIVNTAIPEKDSAKEVLSKIQRSNQSSE